MTHDCAYDPLGPLSSLLVRDKSLPALRRVVPALGFHTALKAKTFHFDFQGLWCDYVPFRCVGSKEGGSQDPSWAGQAPQCSSCFRTASWYQLKGLRSLVRTESNFNCHQDATVTRNMQWITWKRDRRCPATAFPGVHFVTVTPRPELWWNHCQLLRFFCISLQVALPCRHRSERRCCVFTFCMYKKWRDWARSLQDLDEKESAPEKSMGLCGGSWLILILNT